MKKVPIIAGSKRLITHNKKVAERIPIAFRETRENKYSATEPLTPISEIAMVGIREITNSITMLKTIASK